MTYDDLTTALAAKFGIDGLVREDGVCSFEIDGMIVSLVHVEEADALVLHGIVGDPPPDAEGRFGAMLLQANHMFQGDRRRDALAGPRVKGLRHAAPVPARAS